MNKEPAEWGLMRIFKDVNIIDMPINIEPVLSIVHRSQQFGRRNAWTAKASFALGGYGYGSNEEICNPAWQVGIGEIVWQGISSWTMKVFAVVLVL